MKSIASQIEMLTSDIRLWELRKTNAVLAYDKKIAELKARIRGLRAADSFLNADASHGSVLMRPKRKKTP